MTTRSNLIERLNRIAEIIEGVDNRCLAVDGSVPPTLDLMTQEEISEIYKLSKLDANAFGYGTQLDEAS